MWTRYMRNIAKPEKYRSVEDMPVRRHLMSAVPCQRRYQQQAGFKGQTLLFWHNFGSQKDTSNRYNVVVVCDE